MQQHLLRAGWHRGVAQWGVLGQGGQWAPVAGFDGSMPGAGGVCLSVNHEDEENGKHNDGGWQNRYPDPFSPELSVYKTPTHYATPTAENHTSETFDPVAVGLSVNRKISCDVNRLLLSSSKVGMHESTHRGRHSPRRYLQAQVLVGKRHGEGIFVDDPGFLAEWSVEAIALVRRHLFRAGNGKILIPFHTNWTNDTLNYGKDAGRACRNENRMSKLPCWAGEVPTVTEATEEYEDTSNSSMKALPPKARVTITDLPLLVAEVEELLDIMEGMMAIQRQRRLERLRPPSWLRSNWYMVTCVAPPLALLFRRLATKGYGKEAITFVCSKITTFFRERVADPVVAMLVTSSMIALHARCNTSHHPLSSYFRFNEVWRGRESFSDQKVRMEAIESLKKMIRSWLDDTFPEMPVEERISLSEAMDVTMVEKVKEQSMRTFFEINNVIRMSFIEMQYMKKVSMLSIHRCVS